MAEQRILKLIAPFRCQFNLNNPLVAANYGEFLEFLQKLGDAAHNPGGSPLGELPMGVRLEVEHHSKADDGEARYKSMDTGGSEYDSPKYLELTIKGDISDILQKAAKDADKQLNSVISTKVKPLLESLSFGIYDNTIGMCSMELVLDDEEDDWDGLDGWTTQFITNILAIYYPTHIYPTLRKVTQFSQEQNHQFIMKPDQYIIYYDMLKEERNKIENAPAFCQLLWVSRTLVCHKGDIIDGWVLPMDKGDIIDLNDAEAHLGWGNNLVILKDDRTECNLEAIWKGTKTSQYYYAVLDVISKNLTRFVGLTYHKQSNNSLSNLSRDMESVVNAVTIFQVKYKDIYMELQGIPRSVFQRFEKAWDFKSIFDNVQNKIGLCRSNVSRLNQVINQRNQTRVQLVLAVVAGLGITRMMLSLATYGDKLRESGRDAEEGVFGLVDLGIMLSANAMVWIGLMMAFGIGVFILMNRPR